MGLRLPEKGVIALKYGTSVATTGSWPLRRIGRASVAGSKSARIRPSMGWLS